MASKVKILKDKGIYTKDEVVELLKKAGLSVEEVDQLEEDKKKEEEKESDKKA